MAITNSNDSSHIVRTSAQWKSSYDSYDTIPLGVLCVELIPDGSMKIKIGDGHNTFAKLPYVGGQAVSDYYSKRETDERIKAILKEESAMRIKGVLSSEAALPSNPAVGDVYFVLSRSSSSYIEYVYATNHSWIPIGGTPVDSDLSGYATQDYVNEQIDEVNTRIDEIVKGGISSHIHDNKDILDSTTASFTKEDKAKLDSMSSFTSADRDKLNVLIKNSTSFEKIAALEKLAHEHSNKRILDRTTASFTTDYEQKMKWIRPYTGAENGYEGIMGLVPPAQPGEEDYVLNGAGEWVPIEGVEAAELKPATTSKLGGIIVGEGLKVDQFGILSTEKCDCDNVGQFDRTSGTPGTGEIFNSYSGMYMNKATGQYAHAEGIQTTASGDYSHAQGNYTIANGDSQFTLGKFNIPDNDEKYAVIIGGGTADDDRKNIFTIDWSGNIELGISDADGNITYGTINGVDITNITFDGVTDINESEEDNTITVVFSDGTSKDIAIKCDGGDSEKYTAGDGILIYDEKDGDYDEISYIEATGSQYTVLDYQPTTTTRIVTDFAMNPGNSDDALWGTRMGNTNESDQFVLWMFSGHSKPVTGFVYGSNTWDTSTDSAGGHVLNYEETTRLVSDASENGLFINDELIHPITKVHHGFNPIGKLCIFGVNRNNTIEHDYLIKAKIYSMKIYEGSALVIDLVPRVRNSDNVPGFYDTINEVFYPSATTDYLYDSSSRTPTGEVKHIIAAKKATKDSLGSIIVGDGLDISPDGVLSAINDNIGKTYYEGNGIVFELKDPFSIPDGYQEVEYIESNGAVFNTQYVNKANTRIVADMIARNNGNTWQALFGGRYFSNDNFHVMCKATTSSSYGMGNETYIDLIWQNTRILIDFSKDALRISQVETGLTRDPIAINSNGINGRVPIYIFALNDGGSVAAQSSARLYSMKIYENDILVRYFVPVQNLSNGAYGIFDVVTQTYIPPFQTSISIHGEPTSSFAEAKETINVKIGEGLSFDNEGKLKVDFPEPYELPVATESTLGGIIVGDNLKIENGKLSAVLPETQSDFIFEEGPGIDISMSGETYQVIEYIESDGNQGIKTDVIMRSHDVRIECKYCFDVLDNTDQLIFHVGNNNENGAYAYGISHWNDYPNRIGLWVGAGDTYWVHHEPANTNVIDDTVTINYANSIFKSSKYTMSAGQSLGQYGMVTNRNLCLFAGVDSSGDPKSRKSKIKLWNFKVFENNTLTADFVPVIRMSDNKPGLFDRISKQFYSNQISDIDFITGYPLDEVIKTGESPQVVTIANTGVLDVKPSEEKNQIIVTTKDGDKPINIDIESNQGVLDVKPSSNSNQIIITTADGDKTVDIDISVPSDGAYGYTEGEAISIVKKSESIIPDEYQQVEWIRSSGNEYINLDYTTSPVTVIKMRFTGLMSDSGWGCLIGSRSGPYDDASGDQLMFLIHHYHAGNVAEFWVGSNDKIRDSEFPYQQMIDLEIKNGVAAYMIVDTGEVRTLETTISMPVSTYPLYLFSLDNGGTEENQRAKAIVYDLKIYEGDRLVRHFIPAYEKSTGIGGLYETEKGVFVSSHTISQVICGNDEKSEDVIQREINVRYGDGLSINEDNELTVKIGNCLYIDGEGALSGKDYIAGTGITIKEAEQNVDIWNDGNGWSNLAYLDSSSNLHMTYQSELHSSVDPLDDIKRYPILSPTRRIKYIKYDINGNPLSGHIDFHNSDGIKFNDAGWADDNDAIYTIPENVEYVSFALRKMDHISNISISDIGSVTIEWLDVIGENELVDRISLNPATNDTIGGVKPGKRLTIDEDGTLNVSDIAPIINGIPGEGYLIKSLTYTGTGGVNNIVFPEKPLGIISISGLGKDNNWLYSAPTSIDNEYMTGLWGGATGPGQMLSYMSFEESTNTLTLTGKSHGNDADNFNVLGSEYTVLYAVPIPVSETYIFKTLTYTGNGAEVNNIEFPEKPEFVVSIYGYAVRNWITCDSFELTNNKLMYQYGGESGNGVGTVDLSFNEESNVVSLSRGSDRGAIFNVSGEEYVVRYAVKSSVYAVENGNGSSEPYELPIATKTDLGGIKIGDGLEILEDGTVNVIGGSGGSGHGTINGSIIRSLKYTGNGSNDNYIQFPEKPDNILNIYGKGTNDNWVSSTNTPIDQETIEIVYGGNTSGTIFCKMNYDDETNILHIYGGNSDVGGKFNINGEEYIVSYTVPVRSNSDEILISKSFTYIGTGTTDHTIQFPEKPEFINTIIGNDGNRTIASMPFELFSEGVMYQYGGGYGEGIRTISVSFDDDTNIMRLYDAPDTAGAFNETDVTYTIHYLAKHTINGGIIEGSGSSEYELLPATNETLGGVIVGNGLTVDKNGVLSVINKPVNTKYAAGEAISIIESQAGEYDVLEYVISSQTQYVLTDILPGDTTEIYMKYQFTDVSMDSYIVSSGYKFTEGCLMYGILRDNGQILCSAIGTGNNIYDYNSIGPDLDMHEDTYTVTSTTFGSTLTGSKNHSYTLNKTEPIQLFGTPGLTRGTSAKLYAMKITVDGSLISELIPVKNKATSKVGLYDKLTEKIYYSKDGTELEAGPSTGEIIKITGDNIINVKYGDGLNVNENNELFVDGKEDTIPRFTKAEYEQALLDGTAPPPGSLFIITDDEEEPDSPEYELPIATTESLGGVVVGDGLTVDKNGVLSVNKIHAYQVDMANYQPGDEYTPIEESDNVLTAIGKLDVGLITKENKIPRFTKAEYEQALLDGTAPKQGELFIITDDDSSDFKCVQDVIVTRNEVGKLDIVRNGETKTIDIFDQLDILFLNCIEDN